MLFRSKVWGVAIVVATLAACGGGGGGGSNQQAVVASTNAFNVQAGLATLAANGFSKTFTISGSCTGTFTITDGPANNVATFEGTSVLAANETVVANLSGCTTSTTSGQRYYNNAYLPLGSYFSGSSYGVLTSVPAFPTAAHVGDSAVYGHANVYSDSTKSTPTGSQTLSYTMVMDTATTALLVLTFEAYNTGSVLTSTEQDIYRISATGTITPMGLHIQYANGSTVQLTGN